MNIRLMTAEDTEAVSRIEAELFTEPWSRQGFLEALGYDNVVFLVAESSGSSPEIQAYCGMYLALDEAEITNVAVAESFQRQGVGTVLLRRLLAKAEEAGMAKVFLEVRKSNEAALHLYEKIGFRCTGIRPDFYRRPTEDAYTMIRRINYDRHQSTFMQ